MAKREATSELNHENWDEEDESEDAGTFKLASADILKDRVIKTPKRKMAAISSPGTNSPFMAFSGFGGVKKTESDSPFSFLKTNGAAASTESPSSVKKDTGDNSEEGVREKSYYSNLRGLNESVSSWITMHIKKNPLCILTPVFQDYEKHLAEIEEKYGVPSKRKDSDSNSVKPVPAETAVKPFSFVVGKSDSNIFSNTRDGEETNSVIKQSKEIEPKLSSGFSFGNSSGGFSLTDGKGSASGSGLAGFSFGSSATAGFSFANVSAPAVETSKEQEDAESDEPPKVQLVSVPEEDAFYSKRCKLFFKRDNNYQEIGVGTLHLKPAGEKTQLIVRADTTLGTILLNIILGASIPIERVGKNNVLLVCIPDTKVSSNPVPTLLRVKTEEDADELFTKLNEHKK